MFKITGQIEGVAPILFNNPPVDIEAPNTKGKLSLQDKLDEVKTKLHKSSDGQPVIPRSMFKKAMLAGSTKAGLKYGRAGLASFLEATVFLDEDMAIQGEYFQHEHWGRIPPKTGAAVLLRRPAFDTGWTAPFKMTVVDDRRDADQIRRAIEEAGLLVGLAAWRPEYGRFLITKWETER